MTTLKYNVVIIISRHYGKPLRVNVGQWLQGICNPLCARFGLAQVFGLNHHMHQRLGAPSTNQHTATSKIRGAGPPGYLMISTN